MCTEVFERSFTLSMNKLYFILSNYSNNDNNEGSNNHDIQFIYKTKNYGALCLPDNNNKVLIHYHIEQTTGVCWSY